jgi:ribosomal protein S27AE
MNALSVSLVLLVALFVILLLYKILKPKPQVTRYGSQRMCPSCGLITSRLKARCLECGQSLAAVSVIPIIGK